MQGTPLRTEETGRAGLEIIRDSHDIPHIFGTTRSDVMFGSGWVAAEDRGLLLALGLGPAYAAAIGVPGVNAVRNAAHAALVHAERGIGPVRRRTEESPRRRGPEGRTGHRRPRKLGRRDQRLSSPRYRRSSACFRHVNIHNAIAGFAFIGSIFGNGGGAEVADSELPRRAWRAKFGEKEGLKVFRDLREVNDPEAPTTASKAFPYDTVPTGATPGAALVDPGSQSSLALKAAAALKASRRKASNFLLVGAPLTKEGHPVAVMGPQLGYFYPEIVMQGDLHGPGIDAQGVIAPISPYVFIGRGRDFAWSLTSAGSENTQQFLEKLCNRRRLAADARIDELRIRRQMHPAEELRRRQNRRLQRRTRTRGALPGIGPRPDLRDGHGQRRSLRDRQRPRHPRARAGGRARLQHAGLQRSPLPAAVLRSGQPPRDDVQHVLPGQQTHRLLLGGTSAVLAPGTDPSLPTLGTGEYDWQGFLALEQHPHEVDPASNAVHQLEQQARTRMGRGLGQLLTTGQSTAYSCTRASKRT